MRHSWRGVLSALLALSLAVPACAAPVDGETAAARKGGPGVPVSDPGAGPPGPVCQHAGGAVPGAGRRPLRLGWREADDFTFALELQSLTALAGDSHTTPGPGWEHEPDGPLLPHVPAAPGRPAGT